MATLLIALAGCARDAAVVTTPPPVPEAATLDAPSVASAWAAAGLGVPGEAPTLDHWTVAAWTLRADVAVARADLDVARGDRRLAALAPSPTLSLTPEFVTNATAGASPWTVAVLLSQLVEAPGKRRARIAKADADVATAWWSVADAYWRVRSEVRRNALAWSLARAQAAIARDELALRQQARGIAEKRVATGYWQRPELDRASAAALVAASALRGAQAAEAQARAAFAASVGLPVAALGTREVAGLDAELETALARVPEDDRAAAVANRADVARALSEFAAADATWRQAVAQRRPDVTIGPGYTYDKGDRKIVLALDAQLPLRQRADAEVARADAARRAAGARLLKAQSDALAAIDQADAAFADVATSLAELAQASRLQDAAVTSVRERLEAGQADRGELVAALLEANAQRAARLDVLRRAYAAFGALEDATQRPVWPATRLGSPADAAPATPRTAARNPDRQP